MNESLAYIFYYPLRTLPCSLFPNAKLNTKKLDLVATNVVTLRLGDRVLLTLVREYSLQFRLWNSFYLFARV